MTFFPRSARPKVLRRGDCKIAAADVAVVAAISLDPPAVFAAVKVTTYEFLCFKRRLDSVHVILLAGCLIGEKV